MHAFMARGARAVSHQDLDEMEQIQIELLPLERVSNMLLDREVKTIATAAAAGMALHVLAQQEKNATGRVPA
jgi:hypothetical protein